MSVDWLTFKSSLGPADCVSVAYIDEEGTEISIDSECEFKEALRVAKLNKNNHLHLILTVDKAFTQDFVLMNENNTKKMNSVESVQAVEKKKLSSGSTNMKSKKNNCLCKNGMLLEYIRYYLKKFKKELLHELTTSMNESINNALIKERKLLELSSQLNDLSNEQTNIISSSNKPKKSKKSDKDLGNSLSEQKESKGSKKSTHSHASKVGKVEAKSEKLENKSRFEEKLEIYEKKRKLAFEKAANLTSKSNKKSSAIIIENEVTRVRPETQFLLNAYVDNDGHIPLSAPLLVIKAPSGILIDNPIVRLKKLQPKRRKPVFLNVKTTEETGLFKLVFMVVDSFKIIGQPVVVWVEVSAESTPFKNQKILTTDSSTETNSEEIQIIDFDQEIIAKSQKKIEENIMEIEKRLQDIKLLRPNTAEIGCLEKKVKEADVAQKSEKLISVDGYFGVKDEELKQNGTDFCNFQDAFASSTRDDTFESTKIEECENDSEKLSDQDISDIYISDLEEDENFIVVPSWDDEEEKPSLKEDEIETKSLRENNFTAEGDNVPRNENEEKSPLVVVDDLIQLKNLESDEKPEIAKEQVAGIESLPNQPSTSRSRPSSFGDYSMEFKSKKMKCNKSSEYQFTAENLSQPMFSKFTPGEGASTFTFTADSERKTGKSKVATVDSKGKVIYAVNGKGCCLPVDAIQRELGNSSGSTEGHGTKTQQPSGQSNERTFPEIPSVNILPPVFVNGATNMASLAIHTAKSVFNNLQSAFVTEGKTEVGKPACEQKKPPIHVSMEAMFKLFEMGFKDLERNRKLLQDHGSDLDKVIEELVNLQNHRQQQQE